MKVERGEIWLANLDPTKGSEQAGTRPIIIFQESTVSKFTSTIITIPLTTNLRRVALLQNPRLLKKVTTSSKT